MSDLVQIDNAVIFLLPPDANKNTRDRILPYIRWLRETDGNWMQPNLALYRDWLLQKLKSESVRAHLSTIRARYQKLLRDNTLREMMMFSFPADMPFVERRAYVDEWQTRLSNAIHPDTAPVEIIQKQDYQAHIRLSKHQVEELLKQPDMSTLRGSRDSAMFRLMLATGIREEETVLLNVMDLYQEYEGYPTLEIRRGKGAKQRMVLYGDLYDWCVPYVERWLRQGDIKDGALFRGVWKNDKPRRTRLFKTSIGKILAQYRITHRNSSYIVTAHDLRYTYARRMHDAGVAVEAISRNMGHADLQTTLRYIGDIHADRRRPPKNIYGL
jgi:integrase/recombinase XerD